MAQEYTEYLAVHVLNEQQLVSYRTLSRALKVHCNLAKQMLYDFHHKQNTKKPGTVHATYLLTGIRRVTTSSQTNGIHSQDDEDIPMQSSPPLPSSSAAEPHDSIPESSIIRSILLVREEHLAQAKSTFDSISSIHIYSLECNGLSDIHTLTECNRQIDVNYASEDPLQAWKQYGTIQNPNVKRRVGKGTAPPPPAAPIEKNPQAKIAPSATTAKAKEAEMKAEVKPAAAVPTEKKGSTTTSFPKPVQAKRQNSDIFKSFSKAKPPAAASPVPADPDPKGEDDLMTGFSDDEGLDDDELEKEVGEAAKTLQPAGKSKKEREAELQAMMEQEDEEDEAMEDVTAATPDAAPAADVDAPAKAEEAEEPKETVTIENGRRRGKRRIMKKKTVKDEDGYLVTREEAAWESFSEEEPQPKKIKTAAPSQKASTGAKKGGAKAGGGNIMSFFSKK